MYTGISDLGWFMDLRELKGLEIAARSRIAFEEGVWLVPSQSGNGKYRITLKPETCDCEDFSLRGGPCKHIHAARLTRERDHGDQSPKLDIDTIPKRPTYKQDWPAYNLAQTTEKWRFQELLCDLCRGVPEPKRQGTGRPPVPLADRLFAACFKVYSTFSSRRFNCDLQDAHTGGYLSRPLHCNKINSFLEATELTPHLRTLIMRSSLPLKAVETVFSPDSTGFSSSKFERWYDEKYGAHRSSHAWVKAHAICGTRTNIVTAVEIHDKDAADSPQFPALVNATAKNFAVKEVPADKAYLSKDNLQLVEGLGGTAYVPFKTNSTADAGGLWEKMFHYYSLRREEFLKHYHQRSNIESTFSMVKRKFGDAVRSKTDTAMANEVLAKFVCHNVCVVIASQCELGIEPVFWPEQSVETPAILRMPRRG